MTTFGKHLLGEWMLDPAITYLNHGTVGAPPRRILAAQQAIRDEIERQPAKFVLRELAETGPQQRSVPTHMRAAIAPIAEFVGVNADDLVFVDNITAGANAVLRSFPFAAGDEIVTTNLGYGGITNTVSYVATASGATHRVIDLPAPGAVPSAFTQAVADGISDATRMIVIDHLTAGTALVLPIADIVQVCHQRGVLVFVDGAHAPGAIPLDIAAIGADWYSANLHKWLFTPRSLGLLWTAPQHQHLLHSPIISWGLGNGIAAEFDAGGTRDPSPALCAPAALALLQEWGVDNVMGHNHELAWQAGLMLSEMWGVSLNTPRAMIGPMVTLTLPPRFGSSVAESQNVRDYLLFERDIEVAMGVNPTSHGGGVNLRVSAQIYNDLSDVQRLGEAISSWK